MKTRKTLSISILLFVYVIQFFIISGCKPDDERAKNKLVYKPNIYIYPDQNLQLDVTINFPLGGEIINSIPQYNNCWKINVDTNGLINNEYTYLFYESKQPDVWQTSKGWIVTASEIESFFRENMDAYGYEGKEIDDFIEYWIPRLNFYKYYSICPQTIELIEDVILLDFSREPDHILRLFYLVEGSDIMPEELIEPVIDDFTRMGYFAVEWGVIL